MSCALAAENDAMMRAPAKVARKRTLIMSTAPALGGRPIELRVDAIRPHADRPHERFDSSRSPGRVGPKVGASARNAVSRLGSPPPSTIALGSPPRLLHREDPG